MELTEDKLFLIKEVFSKMRYNKMLNIYQIPVEAYLSLKLSSKQIKLLEKMCIDNDVELERLPKKLSNSENIELFKKYRDLKEKLKIKYSKELEEEIYNIRNTIAEGNMEVVLSIILRYFPNIMERNDREDIYQTSYEVLLLFIDRFDLDKGDYFIRYLHKYLIPYLYRRIAMITDDLTIDDNIKLTTLIRRRADFNKKYNREPTIEELMNLLDFSKEEVEELLVIEKRVNTSSYEELENYCEDNYDIVELIDNTFDEYMAKYIDRSSIINIIDTLPDIQKQCILLHFGFCGDKDYNYDEISSILKISHQAVREAVLRGLDNLKISVRRNVLSVIYEDDNNKELIENIKSQDQTYLMCYLIKKLPMDFLLSLLDNLSDKVKETLMLYFGLYDGVEYTRKEISEKYGTTITPVNERIKLGINKLCLMIERIYKNKYVGTEREKYDVLTNMLLNYINSHNVKKYKKE